MYSRWRLVFIGMRYETAIVHSLFHGIKHNYELTQGVTGLYKGTSELLDSPQHLSLADIVTAQCPLSSAASSSIF
jgi:hypothetical protein